MKAETDNAYLRLSPIFNPLYLSYGHSRGLSYKMRINGHYNFSYNKQISFNPYFGYNFKIKKYTLPLLYDIHLIEKKIDGLSLFSLQEIG